MNRALMTSTFLLFGFLASVSGVRPTQAAESVMGFQTWKANRIEDARQVVDRLNGSDRDGDEPSRKRGKAGSINARHQSLTKGLRTDQKLQQAQINLEIAQEFTVNDYFVLYLSQFKQKESFVEAARKLSHEEAAELMMSYQKRLASGENENVTASLSGISTVK